MTNDSLPTTAATTLALDAPPAGGDGGLREALEEIAFECDPDDPEWKDPASGRARCFRIASAALARPDPREQAAAGVGDAKPKDPSRALKEALFACLNAGDEFRQYGGELMADGRKAWVRFTAETPEASAILASQPHSRPVGAAQTPEAAGPGVEPFTVDWFRSLFAEPLWNVPHWQRDVLMAVSALTQPNQTPEAAAPSGSAGEEAPKLWCMHIAGPDDLHAAPDFWTALSWAAELNTFVAQKAEAGRWATDDNWPLSQATVCPWPGTSEAHARHLAAELADRAAHQAKREALAQRPAPQAPVADTAGLESLRAAIYGQPDTPKEITPLSWLRSMLDACDTQEAVQSLGGDDPDAWGEMCGEVRRMVDALDRAALTPPQAARPGDGEGWRKLAADEVEGIASQWDGDGRAYAMTIAAILRSEEQTDIPPADEDTKRIVDRAWKRFQAGVSAPVQAGAVEGRS